jgi:cleavage and polyadenylation specificity factor subunit 2
MKDTTNSGSIRATPLYGGRSESGICTLLELGGYRLLFDCGLSLPVEYDYLEKMTTDLIKAGGVDAVFLSHADLQHVGALPIILGKSGLINTPIICTLPVSKFSQLVLYDFVLNQEMEGEGMEARKYSLDDIDHAFKHLVNLKYSQNYTLPETQRSLDSENPIKRQITVTAIPSGRTMGGTIWRIRCGPAEILYTVDINLRRETLLEAVPLDLLPSSPALMICDASSGSKTASKKKKEKDEIASFLQSAMETLRVGGNVLIPMETAGRLLETLLILHKYWYENKLGLYHLVLLSHMSNNILEFARCQLEWMSDSLTKTFYNGKGNPFDLSMLKCFTDVKTMEKRCPGPKLVLATDGSLSYGLSKELLLKWGGDPRCRVIFLDGELPASLSSLNSNNNSSNNGKNAFRTVANELKKLSTNPPIITAIQMPTKVPLSGQELENYKIEQEKKKQQLEDEILKKRRKNEISRVSNDFFSVLFRYFHFHFISSKDNNPMSLTKKNLKMKTTMKTWRRRKEWVGNTSFLKITIIL